MSLQQRACLTSGRSGPQDRSGGLQAIGADRQGFLCECAHPLDQRWPHRSTGRVAPGVGETQPAYEYT